jgi:hypothetical protein
LSTHAHLGVGLLSAINNSYLKAVSILRMHHLCSFAI